MQFLPVRRDFRKKIVMRPSDEISLEAENTLPAAARFQIAHFQIAHISIEYGQGARRQRYEVAQLRLFLRGQATGAVASLPLLQRFRDHGGDPPRRPHQV